MIGIHELTHRVTLCSMQDVVEEQGNMRLSRKGIFTCWAKIEPKRASNFGAQGFAIFEKGDSLSHLITTRYRTDLDISSAAWIYEERRKSPPRWFKVLRGVDSMENGQWFIMDCRLVERSIDTVSPTADSPRSPRVASPQPVKL